MGVINETAKVLLKTGLCQYFKTTKYGLTIKFFPTRMSKRLWVDSFSGRSKYAEMESFFLGYLRDGDIVVVVGANIGWYTLICAKKAGESGKVYAFEAHPGTFQYLIKNIRLNSLYNIRLFQSALGADHRKIRFSDDERDDMNRVISSGGMQVNVNTLDSFPIHEPQIELLKIDVEGFELFVLKGATELLKRTQTVLFEVWQPHMQHYGYDFTDLFDLLIAAGFKILRLTTSDYQEVSRNYDASALSDLVAVRDVDHFRQRLASGSWQIAI